MNSEEIAEKKARYAATHARSIAKEAAIKACTLPIELNSVLYNADAAALVNITAKLQEIDYKLANSLTVDNLVWRTYANNNTVFATPELLYTFLEELQAAISARNTATMLIYWEQFP
jgi:hypothetical protein